MAPRGLFVVGTDTGVGKTYVTAAIARQLVAEGHRVGVYKPAASGCAFDESDDPYQLWLAAGQPGSLDKVCPQRFAAPLAPHLAARAEGKKIDSRLLREGLEFWHAQSDVILIEGIGGLMSPVSEHEYVADLAHDFGFPLVVVAPNKLGVINQSLQTLMCGAAYRGGLAVAGVVLNNLLPPDSSDDVSTMTNREELERRCPVPLLAELQHAASHFDTVVDWYSIAMPERDWIVH
jgi:dethiobiotin synthetase